jgi:hypothetical protein
MIVILINVSVVSRGIFMKMASAKSRVLIIVSCPVTPHGENVLPVPPDSTWSEALATLCLQSVCFVEKEVMMGDVPPASMGTL